jgi:hypothetical protein
MFWTAFLGVMATFVAGVAFERNKAKILGGTPSSAPVQTTAPIVQVFVGASTIVPIGATVLVLPPVGGIWGAPPTSSDTTVLAPGMQQGVLSPTGQSMVIPSQFEAVKAGKVTVGGLYISAANAATGQTTVGSATITVQ